MTGGRGEGLEGEEEGEEEEECFQSVFCETQNSVNKFCFKKKSVLIAGANSCGVHENHAGVNNSIKA